MILDYHFPDGRHRDDYRVARWRLLLLSELTVGRESRLAGLQEDAAAGQAIEKLTDGAR